MYLSIDNKQVESLAIEAVSTQLDLGSTRLGKWQVAERPDQLGRTTLENEKVSPPARCRFRPCQLKIR